MANALAISLHAEGSETATGTGAAVDMGTLRTAAKLSLDVVSVAGTGGPTLTVTVEDSDDGVANWGTVATFTSAAAATGANLLESAAIGLRRYLRARWVVTGTLPTIRFSVRGEAHQIYFGRGEIERLAIPAAVIADTPASTIADCVISASDELEAGLCQYTLPITAWPAMFRRRGAEIAVFFLMKATGFSPAGADELIVKAYDDAIAWLRMLCSGKVDAPGIIDSTPTEGPGSGEGGGGTSSSGIVVSAPLRGW